MTEIPPQVFADEPRRARERERLRALMALFAELPPPPDPVGLYGDVPALRDRYHAALAGDDVEAVEETFLTLYARVHGHEAPYTRVERARMDELGGYWCHAGGVSPIVKAGDHLRPGSVSADFGAGNGLQGLLMMKLFPHARTVQIELSSRMVEAGRALQGWLGIADERVEWVVGDVMAQSALDLDFIYLYRPVRPEGAGRAFYERFAAELAGQDREVVIFSIADCLREFLPEGFRTFYGDGHLTCFANGAVRED